MKVSLKQTEKYKSHLIIDVSEMCDSLNKQEGYHSLSAYLRSWVSAVV